MKLRLGYDDSLDCFGIHGIGSGFGVLMLCFFVRDSWMADAAASAGGSWTVWNQLVIQLTGIGATIAIAVVGTTVVYFIVEKTMGFRIDEKSELIGLDQSLQGEHGYGWARLDMVTTIQRDVH